ncbi:hypothetical protein GCM10009114_18710 [Aliiglaciecola litoralis]|uniref:4'-phosphopantetheinyl transferase superfamily protein n=2 Tax=Aliiglaciecola litoralis TaxID=582857 RepID=A0ABN1LIV0_9ALTE
MSSSPLDQQEIAQLNRFKYDRDRRSFYLRRVALRHILAKYSGISAHELVINREKQHKPVLPHYSVEFNTSVTAGYALIGISNLPIGIDIEYHKNLKDEFITLGQSVFSSREFAELQNQQDPCKINHTFYSLWCLKEAYLKAIGLGLSVDPRLLTFDLATRTLLSAPTQTTSIDWYFHLPLLFTNYSCAIATPIATPNIRLINY